MPIQSTLARYSQAIYSGLTVATILISYHLYTQRKLREKRRLKRSNARRIRPGRTSTQTPTVANAGSTGTAANTALSQSGTGQPPSTRAGPPPTGEAADLGDGVLSSAELEAVLNDVEQEPAAAPAENGMSPPSTTAIDFESELNYTPESSGKENQNLLNLLYLIAEVRAHFSSRSNI